MAGPAPLRLEASLRQLLSPDTTAADNVNTATKIGVIELNAA
jgi:hypothetical protein